MVNDDTTGIQKQNDKDESNDIEKKSNKHQWLLDLISKKNQSNNVKSKFNENQNIDNDLILKNKALILAPMVEQSDLPFRLLCRKYGVNLAYTPMIHARYFVMKQSYRNKMWMRTRTNTNTNTKTCMRMDENGNQRNKLDRPLIAQIAGNNKEVLLQAAKMLETSVDAIDLNCGCPTKTAKRGRYGAFLLQSNEHLVEIVRYLAANISCPLTVKVRLLPGSNGEIDIEKSLLLYEKLVNAGISLLTVHGRTRFQKGSEMKAADWNAIRRVVQHLGNRIPIIANGNIHTLDDVRQCIIQTGAHGVMSSESILEYPPLFTETQTKKVQFSRTGPGRIQIAREYLDLCRLYPPENGGGGSGMQCIRMHLDVILHQDWKRRPQLRDTLLYTTNIEGLYDIITQIQDYHNKDSHKVKDERLSWYLRHRTK